MDHKVAEESKFAERYLLQELSAVERDEFESHYFDCTECAQRVRTGVALSANARALFREGAFQPGTETHPSFFNGLFGWMRRPELAYALLGMVICFTAYQNLVLMRPLEETVRPQVLTTTTLRPSARGEVPVVLNSNEKLLHVMLDVNTSESFAGLRGEVLDATGSQVLSFEERRSISGGSLSLLLPAQKLVSGTYTLVLRGTRENAEPVEIERYSFTIQRS